MKYYLAGFYLIQVRPIAYTGLQEQAVLTCSSCINTSLLDYFSRSWTSDAQDIQKAQSDFGIDLETISNIQDWTDQNDTAGKIGYSKVFNTLESAIEYHQKFFTHLDQVKLLGLYLPESEANRLIEDFKDENRGEDGIRKILTKKELETDEGIEIGFDLIGVEIGGNFHSFHCHYQASFLEDEFKVEVNNAGLIKTETKWEELIAYMNDEKSAVEPVPWYFAKVKLMA